MPKKEVKKKVEAPAAKFTPAGAAAAAAAGATGVSSNKVAGGKPGSPAFDGPSPTPRSMRQMMTRYQMRKKY